MKRANLTKFMFGGALVAAMAATLAALPNTAHAVGNSVTVNLTATVATKCSITAPAGAASFDVSTQASTAGTQLATLSGFTDTCNTKNGYTIAVKSQNGAAATPPVNSGLLIGTTGNTDTVVYTVNYGGTNISLTAGQGTSTVFPKAAGGISHALQLSFTGNANLTADTYTDTLTLTIANQ